jgi:hypothetical protein
MAVALGHNSDIVCQIESELIQIRRWSLPDDGHALLQGFAFQSVAVSGCAWLMPANILLVLFEPTEVAPNA